MKGLNLQMTDEVLRWIRDRTAKETIAKGEKVSMNAVILELIEREMEIDAGEEMAKTLPA